MDVTANEYTNDVVNAQLIIAKEIIGLMRDFIANDKLEILVDIGCGSGNLTSLINEALDCSKVIGIDIDQNMIDYANANSMGGNNNIIYLTQNIDCEWNEMRPELKALEGKVLLVFTNYALHWIKNKENTVKNIHRLLANGGKFFARVFLVPDPLTGIDSRKLESKPNLLKIPPKEKQFSDWIGLSNANGLTVVKSDLVEVCHPLREDAFHNTLQKLIYNLALVYIDANNDSERKQFISDYGDDIKREHNKTREKSFVDEKTGQRMLNSYGHCFITYSIKKSVIT